MTTSITTLTDLEARATAGESFSAADVARVFASSDLIAIGALGEAARKARSGDRVTFGVVFAWDGAATLEEIERCGEVRITATPESVAHARSLVAAVAGRSQAPLTGFSTAHLLELAGGDHLALVEIARELSAAGLVAVAETPIDRLGEAEHATEVIRAVRHGGLEVRRLTVDRAALDARLELILRAAEIQAAIRGLDAFAPLPRLDPVDVPSTGYDDVKTIAAARLVCAAIPRIQVDWQLYGPKLAQVAIAYGADDIDNVSAVDTLKLGPRRSPREDIARQIRAAFAQPIERDGRFSVVSS
jgi:hypothetical protein